MATKIGSRELPIIMRGDKLLIRKYHTRAAHRIARLLTPGVSGPAARFVITISGESGSGKTEIAHELARELRSRKIKSVTLHQDDYFRLPPKTNYRQRRLDLSMVGPREVKLDLLNRHVSAFKTRKNTSISKPLVDFDRDRIIKERLSFRGAKVMIVEGTYTALLDKADSRVFLSRTYSDTLKTRRARKRDKIDRYDRKILQIEHSMISKHKKLADIVVKKDYSVYRPAPAERIKRICMLTIHGHVMARPILGKTDTGGQVTYVLELSKALAKKGIKVDIYTRKFQHRKRIEKVARNVRIIRIPCGGDKFIAKERLFPYLDTFAGNMEKFISKNGLSYDIYHSHYWDAGYVAMKLTERLGYFFVHTFHSLGAWKKEQMGGDPKEMEKLFNFRKRISVERAIFRKTRALVMTSTEMIKRARKFYNYRSRNYVVVPAGVNTSVFRPLKKGEKNRRIDVPANYCFWVGRFAANKGLDYLLRAFADIAKKEKDLFVVIGGGSMSPNYEEKKVKEKLSEIIERSRINTRVFFVRHIKDHLMPSYYRKAKFFVLPSRFEPFGMSAAEAMACGTAAIVSERAGIGKYLKNKRDCLIVNPANKKDLGWALRVLNRNWTFRRKIAKNGLALARREFTWTVIADKSLNFYRALLGE